MYITKDLIILNFKHNIMSSYKLNNMKKFLPYKLIKRIDKTKEGRSGNEIYKRRNRRSYRVLMQYDIWNSLIDNPSKKEFLDKFEEGYVVLASPKIYFGNNYPEKSKELNDKFRLGENGFVFYTLLSEYEKYKPLSNWEEVVELDTKGNNNFNTWAGDYALNIKNGNYISMICKKNHPSAEKKEIASLLKERFGLESGPDQCGLGNYDYDYANPKTMEDVQYQMLYLILNSKSKNGKSFAEFLYDHYDDIKMNKDKGPFKNYMAGDKNKYLSEFQSEFNLFKEECERRNLLNFDELSKLGVWNKNSSEAICPLCHKPVYADEFFDDIVQAEGRQVLDNTQKSIVLMHVDALRPGKMNHRPYNLGWGHNFCNLIQGDKDISETITAIKEILASHNQL